MDFETFVNALFSLIKSSDDLYFVLYAVATCLLTQAVKKLVVNKVSVDILHKFDVAVILPFIFGAVFAAVDLVFVQHYPICFKFFTNLAVSAATIGALATVVFKFVSALSGQSLKSLLKDDMFGIFYNQLLYFGNVRRQLLSKELSLKDFVSEVKLISANAVQIYSAEDTTEAKREKLFRLLDGVIAKEDIVACVDVLHRALTVVSQEK